IAEAFFQEIAVALGSKRAEKSPSRRAAEWRRYAADLNVASAVFGGLRMVYAGAFGLLALLAVTLGLVHGSLASWLAYVLGGLFALPALLLAVSSRFAANVAAALEARALFNQRSASERRKEVSAKLQELIAPVVVIVDDIDRLTSDEACLLFQLVKA